MGYCSNCGKTIEQEVGLCEECRSKDSGLDNMDALLQGMDISENEENVIVPDNRSDDALEDMFSRTSIMGEDGTLDDIDMDEFDIDSLLQTTDDIELPSMEDMMNAEGQDELDALLAADAEKVDSNMTVADVLEDPNANMSPEAIEALFAQMTDDSGADINTDTENGRTLDEEVISDEEITSDEELISDEEFTSDEELTSDGELASYEESMQDIEGLEASVDSDDSSEFDDINLEDIDLMSLLTTDDDSLEMMLEDSPVISNGDSAAEEVNGSDDKTKEALSDTTYTHDGRTNVASAVESNSDANILIDSNLLKLEDETDEGQSMADVFSDALSALSSEQDEQPINDGEMAALLDNVRVNTKKKKKKKGIKESFSKLFGNIVDEKEIEKAKAEKEEASQAERLKEEAAQKKKEKAEADKQAKKEAKEAKAREKEEKKQIKEAKKQAKKEEKELKALEEAEEIEGRINKVGAAIVFVVLGIMAAFIFLGTRMFSYGNSIKNAQTYFDNGDYSQSYQELLGVDVREDDELLYQKVITVMHVYKQLEAYDVYYKESKYPEALDSLLKGIREYEKYMPDAVELDVTADLESVKSQIVTEMEAEFGITEDMAKEINQITDSTEYSRRVYDLAQSLALNMQMSIEEAICYKKEELL